MADHLRKPLAIAIMKFEEIINTYALNDGEIVFFNINFPDRSCTTKLKVRRYFKKNKFEYCVIELRFPGVHSIDISEDFRTGGDYADITFTKTTEGKYYFSVDPYNNTGQPDERDNFVIVSSSLAFTAENGEVFQVQ